jgi:hypothetical protein
MKASIKEVEQLDAAVREIIENDEESLKATKKAARSE